MIEADPPAPPMLPDRPCRWCDAPLNDREAKRGSCDPCTEIEATLTKGQMPMTVLTTYDHLPQREHLDKLADFIGDMDGKTIATPTDSGFIDEGTVDAEDAVVAFNAIVAALSATGKRND